MKPILFAGLAAAALVAGCNKPAPTAGETPAPEATAPVAAPAPEAVAPAAPAEMPADQTTPEQKAEWLAANTRHDALFIGDGAGQRQ